MCILSPMSAAHCIDYTLIITVCVQVALHIVELTVSRKMYEKGLLEESVCEDCQPRKKKPGMWMRPRSSTWFDTILKNALDSLWIEHLRLPRQEEEQLAEMLKEELAPSDFCVRNPVPLLECVCIALFKLAVVNIVLQQSILEFQMQLCCVVSLHSVQR